MGRAIALLLAAHGASVGVLDVDPDRVGNTVAAIEEAGGRSLGLAVDIAEAEAVGEAVGKVGRELGKLGALVNCAGIWMPEDGRATELPLDVWHRTLAVNLTGTFLCCRYAIPAIAAAGGGSVVNIGSPLALRPEPVSDAYAASKGAVLALTLSLAQTHAADNVRVNAVLPGAVATAMTKDAFAIPDYRRQALAHTPLGRIGAPEDIAGAVLYLVSDEASFVTGAVLAVDGGWLVSP
jgi:NAD(P)-dependent dehydrogenase (short-subunit alcohol dehydrogenase family)